MQKNIQCLIQACKNLEIDYKFIDKEQNFVCLNISGYLAYFRISITPFNLSVFSEICKDKMHSYQLLHPLVKMPKTIQFLDYNTDKKYQKYLEHDSENSILDKIEETFTYPLVMKKNKGGLGINVYLCSNKKETKEALGNIFNQKSKNYDYVALAQDFVSTQEEYRLVCAYGKPVLAYTRGNASNFNLQYWEKGEVATVIEDKDLINNLYQFIKPVFSIFDIGFVGFDIVRSKDNHFYLIELNSSPKFDHVIESNGNTPVIKMYEEALKLFCKKNKLL